MQCSASVSVSVSLSVYLCFPPSGSHFSQPPYLTLTSLSKFPCLIPVLGRSPAERNGNPLQYSCLENSTNRGAWWATVHGVAKSRTWRNHRHHQGSFPSRSSAFGACVCLPLPAGCSPSGGPCSARALGPTSSSPFVPSRPLRPRGHLGCRPTPAPRLGVPGAAPFPSFSASRQHTWLFASGVVLESTSHSNATPPPCP